MVAERLYPKPPATPKHKTLDITPPLGGDRAKMHTTAGSDDRGVYHVHIEDADHNLEHREYKAMHFDRLKPQDIIELEMNGGRVASVPMKQVEEAVAKFKERGAFLAEPAKEKLVSEFIGQVVNDPRRNASFSNFISTRLGEEANLPTVTDGIRRDMLPVDNNPKTPSAVPIKPRQRGVLKK